jgi:TonB family protein
MKSKLLVFSLMAMAVFGQSAIRPAAVTRTVAPKAESLSMAVRVPGAVKCRVTLNAKGEVQGIQVLSGRADLVQAALRTVGTWTFAPATVRGQAVPSDLDVLVQFAF